jgi:signal transduction histidine kinase
MAVERRHDSCAGTPGLPRDLLPEQTAATDHEYIHRGHVSVGDNVGMRRAGRAMAYILGGGVTAVAGYAVLVGLVVAAASSLVLVGVPFLPDVVRVVRSLASAERHRSARLLGGTIPAPYAELSGSSFAQVRTLLRDPLTYRDGAWLAVHAVLGTGLALCWLMLCLAAVAGPVTMLIWWTLPADAPVSYVVPIDGWSRALTVPPLVTAGALVLLRWGGPVIAAAQARLYRALLAPSARNRLAARVELLSATRAGALDAHAAELRRIERDLHDGMQARLVSVAIQLGLAQRQRLTDPHTADRLIERAHAGVEQTLAGLREVVRSIYPPILADRGLADAVLTLAAECSVPVRTSIGSIARPPAAVETAAYFVVAEALTNIVKHSDATEATLSLDQAGDRIVVEVTDNGRGGADPGGGTGLTGVGHRAAALDGRMTLDSPPGGPTTLRVELPCGS